MLRLYSVQYRYTSFPTFLKFENFLSRSLLSQLEVKFSQMEGDVGRFEDMYSLAGGGKRRMGGQLMDSSQNWSAW